ncbi:MAG: hypothetical protein ISS93_02905, partial [Candidatus Aenigmarchaeota archaeon]|nr:hypothetical protein [Candidatus Aenigmarchaeota archaeon]
MSVINTTTTTINIDFNKKPMWRIKVGGGESEINIAPASDGEGGANFGSFEDAIEACKPCPSMTGILELIKKGELDDGDRVNVARLSVFKLERNGSETHLFQWRGDEALEEDLTALHQKRKGKQEVLRILIEDREVNEELAELLVRKAGGLALLAHDWVMEITERSGREALLIDTARCIIG